jgi:hypothetical protein
MKKVKHKAGLQPALVVIVDSMQLCIALILMLLILKTTKMLQEQGFQYHPHGSLYGCEPRNREL